MSQNIINLNDTTPAAPSGNRNIVWRSDTNGHVSASLPPFVASGAGHKPGAVPDTPGTAGATLFLCEDGTWSLPPGLSSFNQSVQVNGVTVSDDYFATVNYKNGFPPVISGTATFIIADSYPGIVVNFGGTVVMP